MDDKQRKQLYWQLPFLLLLVAGTFFIARGRRTATPYQHNEGFIFGTVYSLTYQADADLHSQVVQALKQVDREFSMFNDSSTVAAINRGEQPARSAMFQEVYDLARQVNADTRGAFDITVAPLVNAWGFGLRPRSAADGEGPTPAQVDSLLGIRSQLDFSAIAKGYGCDVAARTLQRHGVENFMVEIGGEVVTHGSNPNGQQWRIGITRPTDDSLRLDGELQAVVPVANAAMATSGNYRNFYYKGGRKYAHTIDPRTGYPVQHELLSATVFAPTCARADAYATAFMVLGLQQAQELLGRHPELLGYLIYTDPESGQLAVWHSPELTIEE